MERLKARNNFVLDNAINAYEHTADSALDRCTLDFLKELRDYRDAEEQGLLPKFHLGDEFWTMWLGKPLKAKIVMLQQKKNGLWKYRFCDEQSHTHDYEENEYGKYFWATKEEAEQMGE